MSEIWKDVPGYEGFYQVSDMGRVRSVDRIVKYSHGVDRMQKGKILTPCISGNGYHKVTLCGGIGEKDSQPTIHSMVLSAFAGPRPDGMQGCHNNGNKSDNSLLNLRYASSIDNHNDRRAHGTNGAGEKNSSAKLSEVDIIKIRKLYKKGSREYGSVALSRIYKVLPSTIWDIANYHTWTHVREADCG